MLLYSPQLSKHIIAILLQDKHFFEFDEKWSFWFPSLIIKKWTWQYITLSKLCWRWLLMWRENWKSTTCYTTCIVPLLLANDENNFTMVFWLNCGETYMLMMPVDKITWNGARTSLLHDRSTTELIIRIIDSELDGSVSLIGGGVTDWHMAAINATAVRLS